MFELLSLASLFDVVFHYSFQLFGLINYQKVELFPAKFIEKLILNLENDFELRPNQTLQYYINCRQGNIQLVLLGFYLFEVLLP